MEDDYPRMRDTKDKIEPHYYELLRRSVYPNLYYGSFNLTKTRTLAHEIAWKWTERTGKFIGCQFWSIRAKDFFNEELKRCYGNTVPFDKAWNLA